MFRAGLQGALLAIVVFTIHFGLILLLSMALTQPH